MTQPLVQQLLAGTTDVLGLYHRLILLVGPPGTGKTAALRQFADDQHAPLINVNLELSRALLDVVLADRPLAAPRLLKEIIESRPGDTVLLDNLEILFAPDLKLDPLRALQQLSRNRTVIASWNGHVEANRLVYAEPSHPEFRDYPASGLMVIATSRPKIGA